MNARRLLDVMNSATGAAHAKVERVYTRDAAGRMLRQYAPAGALGKRTHGILRESIHGLGGIDGPRYVRRHRRALSRSRLVGNITTAERILRRVGVV